MGEAWGFEDWVETERVRLREMAAGAAWSLAHEQVSRGDPVEGERTAQKALGLIWTDETPLRKFIEELAKAGDGAAALNLYEKFCSRLRKELELEPSAQTEAVAVAIRNGDLRDAVSAEASAAAPAPAIEETSQPSLHGSAPPPSGPPETGRKRRIPLMLMAVMAITAIAIFAYATTLGDNPPEPVNNRVVVPPLENRTGDPEFDETAIMLAEWIGDAATQVSGVDLVPVTYARQYASEAESGGSKGVLQAVAERTQAGWVIGGGISDLGDSLELRANVLNMGLGREEQSVVEVAPKSAPHETYRVFVERVAGALAYEFDPFMEEEEAGSQPLLAVPTYEAYREYRLGYSAYNHHDKPASFEHNMAAYALDSTLVRAVIAAAFMAPDRATTDSLAELALRRQDLLSRTAKLGLVNLVAYLANDRLGQLNSERELAALRPNGFPSLIHGMFALNLNLPREALEAILCYDPSLAWRREEAHLY